MTALTSANLSSGLKGASSSWVPCRDGVQAAGGNSRLGGAATALQHARYAGRGEVAVLAMPVRLLPAAQLSWRTAAHRRVTRYLNIMRAALGMLERRARKQTLTR